MTDHTTETELVERVARAIENRRFGYEPDSRTIEISPLGMELARAALASLPAPDNGLREALERRIRELRGDRRNLGSTATEDRELKLLLQFRTALNRISKI